MRRHRERSWLFLGPQESGLGWPGTGPGRRSSGTHSAQGQNRTPPTPRPATSFHSGNGSRALAVVRPRGSPRVAHVSPGRRIGLLVPCGQWNAETLVSGAPPPLSTHGQGAISKQPEVSVPCSHGALTFGTVLCGVATARIPLLPWWEERGWGRVVAGFSSAKSWQSEVHVALELVPHSSTGGILAAMICH